MKQILKNQKGMALATVIILMAVLVVFGAALLSMSSSENRFVKKQEYIQQAHYIAYSAANAFAAYIEINPDSFDDMKVFVDDTLLDGGDEVSIDDGDGTGYVNANEIGSKGSGEYALNLEKEDADGRIYQVEAMGKYEDTTQKVTLNLSEMAYFNTALLAVNDIVLEKSTTVADGNGAPFVAGNVTQGDGTFEDGDVITSETIPDSSLYINALNKAFGPAPDREKFMDGFPEIADLFNNTTAASKIDIKTTKLTYDMLQTRGGYSGIYCGGVDFESNSLNIENTSGNEMIVVFDWLFLNASGNIDITTTGDSRVSIYILGRPEGDITIRGDKGSLVAKGDLSVHGETGSVIFYAGVDVGNIYCRTGNSNYAAMLVAPESTYIFEQGASTTFGSVIAKDIIIDNGSDFEYPPGYEGLFGNKIGKPSLGFQITDWGK